MKTFTKKNSAKLFLGIFLSVVAMFALVYVVQNPLFKSGSQAATTYTYTLSISPTLSKSGCNSKISSYTVYSQWINPALITQTFGSTTYSFKKSSVPSQFTQQVTTAFKGAVSAKQTVTAYDASGKKIGNSLSLGLSASIASNSSRTRNVNIPCSGY